MDWEWIWRRMSQIDEEDRQTAQTNGGYWQGPGSTTSRRCRKKTNMGCANEHGADIKGWWTWAPYVPVEGGKLNLTKVWTCSEVRASMARPLTLVSECQASRVLNRVKSHHRRLGRIDQLRISGTLNHRRLGRIDNFKFIVP